MEGRGRVYMTDLVVPTLSDLVVTAFFFVSAYSYALWHLSVSQALTVTHFEMPRGHGAPG